MQLFMEMMSSDQAFPARIEAEGGKTMMKK